MRIWVPEAEAELARQLLAKLVRLPPTQEDFEREETMAPSEPRGASAVRWLLATLLGYGAVIAIIAVVLRCGR